MRLLQVDSGAEMRGGQWQALYLAEELAARGHNIKLLSKGALLEEAKKRGLEAEPVSALAVTREGRRADLTHVHDAASHTLAAAASVLDPATPLVVSRRVAFPPGDSAVSRWKYSRATQFIAVSRFVGGILETTGIPANKIRVIHDGVPLPPEPIPYASRDPLRIVCLASDDPQKGGALLNSVAGSTGLTLHRSRALWDDLPTASLFVYLTQSEGLGSGALLAMAHGVPVIASRVGGLPEIVEHGVTGLLTENATEAVAEAIRRILGDRQLAASLSAAGRTQIEQHHTVARMTTETLDRVYRPLLDARARTSA